MRIDWRSFTKKYTPEPKGLPPIGTRIYVGKQGSGKTASMVRYAVKLHNKHKKLVIFSNVRIASLKDRYKYISTTDEINKAIQYQNGQNGVLILLDEAFAYFSNKSGTSLEMMTALGQQRKDRKRIIFTTQQWAKLDIEARREVPEVIKCRKFGKIMINTLFDGESVRLTPDYGFEMDKISTEIWKIHDKVTKNYDTLQKIYTNDQLLENMPMSQNILISNKIAKKRK